jgi:hypothetical protein
MSDKKFKFISPGVFVDEIDNSQLPAEAAPVGPLLIGRTRKGPGMKPVTVSSFSEFVSVFGEPVAGGTADDVWREGNRVGPTYAAYAAQAWLKNNPTVTMVRLLGEQHPDVVDGASGAAGYKIGAINDTEEAGGAYGLFVWPSGTVGAAPELSGTLAAVFYVATGSITLSGSNTDGNPEVKGCELLQSQTNGDFVVSYAKSGTTKIATASTYRFNFDRTSDKFIRKVFSTNPTLLPGATNAKAATSDERNFFLGETFEHHLDGHKSGFLRTSTAGGAATDYDGTKLFGAIMPMQNNAGATTEHNDRKYGARKSSTGWFIGQDLTSNHVQYKPESQQKLFRFEAQDAGEQLQNSIKISIVDIKAASNDFDPYGSFTVLVRRIDDTDSSQVVLERFSNCNLNPASPNYVARQVGDKYSEYDSKEKRLRYYGNYLNKSEMIRVVMNEDVDRGTVDPAYLPFGFFGHIKYRDVCVKYQEDGLNVYGDATSTPANNAGAYSMVDGGGNTSFSTYQGHGSTDAHILYTNLVAYNCNIRFPEVPLVESSSQGAGLAPNKAFFGMYTGRSTSDAKFNHAVKDCLRAVARGAGNDDLAPEGAIDVTQALTTFGGTAANADWTLEGSKPYVVPYVFSLDDVKPMANLPDAAVYARGARAGALSFTAGKQAPATSADAVGTAGDAVWQDVINAGFTRFTTCFHGGFDGLDITEREPFRNSGLGGSETDDYALHSLVRAVDIVRDPETAQYSLLAAPGITNTTVTQKLLDVCEDRGDAMAIIDLENVFTASTENSASLATRSAATLDSCVNSLRDRGINSSYGACYYPWVRISDTLTNQSLWAPPSVAALGAYSYNDRVKAPWFAPAGFSRGGLTEGAGGVPVLDVSRRLSSDERDKLYEANINPIAQFPAEGIVIFGQKTLQVTPSALDRVNVRRLMVFLKREISFIASRMLFDQNTQSTWNRFKGQAEPILRSVKSRFGLSDFRLVLDESTTTPDLIDRNIMYAKILLKPTRSVEFFAIDFVITNTGASFDD